MGSELFTAAGPDVVRALRDELAADVFLDLKFHDIPNTVARRRAQRRAAGRALVTVHASGGQAMLEAAAARRRRGVGRRVRRPRRDGADLARRRRARRGLGADGDLDVEHEVLRLAGLAARCRRCTASCAAARRRRRCASGSATALAPLVPGIRLAGGAAHDQARVMTPAAAQAAGARYLILGRAVTAAADPAAAMERVLAELRDDALIEVGPTTLDIDVCAGVASTYQPGYPTSLRRKI